MLSGNRTASRISLPRNISSTHTLEEIKFQLSEFVSRLEDYLNHQVNIHFLDKLTERPTLLKGDLVFDFTDHPEFATLQQWNGKKLVPLDLGGFGGFVDLVTQGVGSGTDASLFLRSDGAGHWVLAAGPVGPAGADGMDGSVWYNDAGAPAGGLGVNGDYYLNDTNGDVYFKFGGSWSVILNIVGPIGVAWTDYTPSAAAFTGTITTFGTKFGRYHQVGKTVWFSMTIPITTNGSGASFVWSSLPVAAKTGSTFSFAGRETNTGKMLTCIINPGYDSSKLIMLNYDETYPGGDGKILACNGVYESD